jgi:hypothetical protein
MQKHYIQWEHSPSSNSAYEHGYRWPSLYSNILMGPLERTLSISSLNKVTLLFMPKCNGSMIRRNFKNQQLHLLNSLKYTSEVTNDQHVFINAVSILEDIKKNMTMDNVSILADNKTIVDLNTNQK